jgi:hypothetical protein
MEGPSITNEIAYEIPCSKSRPALLTVKLNHLGHLPHYDALCSLFIYLH